MRRVLATIAIATAIGACSRDADAPVANTTNPGSGSSALGPTELPEIPGAKLLVSRAASPEHAVATWCIDEADAGTRIAAALTASGWTSIEIRGRGDARAIAAKRGDRRFSAQLSGADDRCGGTVVNATVMRLGAIAPD